MRWYLCLIVLAVTLAFIAGYLTLSFRDAPHTVEDPVAQIRMLRESFRKTYTPVSELNLKMLFPVGDPAEFIDPGQAMPQNKRYSFAAFAKLYRYALSCRGTPPAGIIDASLAKAWQWMQFKCADTVSLPEHFFETAPFFHPLGVSYALLAMQSMERFPLPPDWLKTHIHLFHVTEIKLLDPKKVTLEPQRALLGSLDLDALKAIADSDEIVLSRKYVLYRQAGHNPSESPYAVTASGYAVFPRSDWDSFFASTPFTATTASLSAPCELRDGRLCWRASPAQIYRSAQRPTALLFAVSMLLAGFCLFSAIKKYLQQEAEEEKKRFALQTLTHELRTPLTSLVLASEEVMDRYDLLPIGLQRTMVGMCDDIQRLQRLAEASKQYLSSYGAEGLIRFQPKAIQSVNGFVSDVLFPFEKKISLKLLDKDQSFTFDGYWVGICLKNLVENAIQHGKPPVCVSITGDAKRLEMTIQDSGNCPAVSFEALAQPFVKGTASQGLGLGLTIVKKVLKSMKADLEFDTQPTRFRIRLEETA